MDLCLNDPRWKAAVDGGRCEGSARAILAWQGRRVESRHRASCRLDSVAGPEIIALVTPSAFPSREPAAFCESVLEDTYAHVDTKHHRKRYRKLSQELRRRKLFAAAVMG